MCIGGSTIDTVLLSDQPISFKTSNPVTTIHNFGGVARNVAENAARLGVDVSLISLVGDDENGRSLIAHLKGLGVDTSGVSFRSDLRTATYTSVVTGSEAVVGFSDMEIFDKLPSEFLDRLVQHFVSATWVFADCNLPASVLFALLQRKKGARFQLALDAVSTAKAVRLPQNLENVDALFLREEEAQSYIHEELDPTKLARELAHRGAKNVAVISRDFSVAVATPQGETHIPAPKADILDTGGGKRHAGQYGTCKAAIGRRFRVRRQTRNDRRCGDERSVCTHTPRPIPPSFLKRLRSDLQQAYSNIRREELTRLLRWQGPVMTGTSI